MKTTKRALRLAALAAAAAALGACKDATIPHAPAQHLEIVVNSVDNSLTLLDADSSGADAHTVGLGAVQASPVSIATRGAFAVVPEGIYPFAAVVDLRSGALQQVPLHPNSGATGVAFLNDSVAVVANPGLDSISLVNVLRRTLGPTIAVGTYPQAVVAGGSGNPNVYVLNANLVNFAPAGPGSVSVVGRLGTVTGTIPLTGINPQTGVVSGNTLYVINAGHFGGNDGSLSVVNLTTGHEDLNVPGFGEFPGSIDVGPDGNVYVGVYGVGIVVWNPGSRSFVRGLANPLKPGDTPPVSAVAFDQNGKMHALNPGQCAAAGKEYRVAGATVERTAATGVCPFALAFATLIPVD